MDGRLIKTDCDEAGYYVVPNVLSPRDLVSRPDNMDKTVPYIQVLSDRNKNTTYIEANVLSMYAKFRLHPPYGF